MNGKSASENDSDESIVGTQGVVGRIREYLS